MMGKKITMNRHFLTQLFNPFLAIIGYFNRNIFTLKRIFILSALLIPALSAVSPEL
jgi:hypothetical protein